MGETKRNATLLTLCLLQAGCGDGEQAATNEHGTLGRAQQAINYAQEWPLPVPVGLNPLDLVLGAEQMNINDRATIHGDIAAMGQTVGSNIGHYSEVGNVWVRSDVLIRGATISGFVKASGAITIQPTTTYGDPEENREHVTIEPDNIFTVTMATSDTGAAVTSTSIGPGTYGAVIVQPYQELTLNAPGLYKFASLDLEPYSVLHLPAGGLTQINVHSNLILRSPLGTAESGLVVMYAGTNSVQIDSLFTGDLFIAPNATVEFKHSAIGRFFAKQIVVHQELDVTPRPLFEGARELFMPSTFLRQLDEVAPASSGHAEIASAILTPTIASCTADPMAFVSHQSSDVLSAKIDLGGHSFFNGQALPRLPVSSTAPASCLDSPLQGYPPGLPSAYGYATNPTPAPRPYFTVSPYTDNVMSRLADGRVLELGFAFRSCEDFPVSVGSCPAGVPSGSACNSATDTDPCFYANPTPDVGAEDLVCNCVSNLWQCNLRRVDATGLSLRMSSDCGNSWSSQYLDMVSLGLLPGTDGGGTIDRPELYVDPYADRLFVSGSMTPIFGGLDAGVGARSVMVVGTPKSAATADAITFSVYKDDPWDGGPQVMTTVPDAQARFPDGSLGEYVYVVQAHCGNSATTLGAPLIDIETPFGWKVVNLQLGLSDDFLCRNVAQPNVPIRNSVSNITVAGIPSVPPKVRIAYPAKNTAGQQVAHIFVVTLRSSNGYSELQAQVELEGTIGSGSPGDHLVFPQLIPVDGVAGSDGRTDTPMVLRYARLDGDGDVVSEEAQVLYSGLFHNLTFLGQSSLSNMFGGSCGVLDPGTGQYPVSCFLGDYRYGAFFEKQGSILRYFTPWTGEVNGKTDIRAIGATIDVVP